MSNLSALIGAIIYAWLPEEETPSKPGPKFRPVVVMDVDPVGKRVRLAYGTSQHVDVNRLGEITVTTKEIPQLKLDTKFCFGKSFWIPLTNEYLSLTKMSGGFSVIGHIPKVRSHEFVERLLEVV